MIKKFFINITLLLLTTFSILSAQYKESGFGLALGVNYTTTSRMFYFPNSDDKFLRNEYTPMDDISGYQIDLRYRLTDQIILGASVEYAKKTRDGYEITVQSPTGIKTLEVDEGYLFIPLELSIYYFLPFSTERFKFYMGGGMGFYLGNHVRDIGDVYVETEKRETNYGIHVATGMEFMATDFLSVRGEMRFRDAEFELLNKYNKQGINLGDEFYYIPSQTFESKINLDGAIFSLSLVWQFSL